MRASPRTQRVTPILGSVTLAAAAAATAIGAHAAPGVLPPQRVLVLPSPNRGIAHRRISRIDRIVIHVSEEPFRRAVRLMRSPRRGASAHYVISRRGQVVQLVSTSNIAWHSGNRRMNRRSIGIEHEGWIEQRRVATEAEYRASARLVAYLAWRAGIPIDRRHIIGHDEVPDPFHRGELGGADHHLDPGPHWRWRHYLQLIRFYARQPERPRYVQAPRLY